MAIYQTNITDPVNPPTWSLNRPYLAGETVRHTDGDLYMANGFVPINTAFLVSRIAGGATWKPVVQPLNYRGLGGSTQTIHEFGMIECPASNWQATFLHLGGMTFTNSTNINTQGSLMYIRQSGCTQSQNAGTQYFQKRTASGVISGGYTNETMWYSTNWNNSATTLAAAAVTSAYDHISHHLMTRDAAGGSDQVRAYWHIDVHSTGSSSLVMMGRYWGPRVIT
jgi:hypothetical protein